MRKEVMKFDGSMEALAIGMLDPVYHSFKEHTFP